MVANNPLYFDYISPNGDLAWTQLPRSRKRKVCAIEPVRFCSPACSRQIGSSARPRSRQDALDVDECIAQGAVIGVPLTAPAFHPSILCWRFAFRRSGWTPCSDWHGRRAVCCIWVRGPCRRAIGGGERGDRIWPRWCSLSLVLISPNAKRNCAARPTRLSQTASSRPTMVVGDQLFGATTTWRSCSAFWMAPIRSIAGAGISRHCRARQPSPPYALALLPAREGFLAGFFSSATALPNGARCGSRSCLESFQQETERDFNSICASVPRICPSTPEREHAACYRATRW